jgi:hypothetical protein
MTVMSIIYESGMNLRLQKGHENIRYSSLWKREVRRDFCGGDIIEKSPLFAKEGYFLETY